MTYLFVVLVQPILWNIEKDPFPKSHSDEIEKKHVNVHLLCSRFYNHLASRTCLKMQTCEFKIYYQSNNSLKKLNDIIMVINKQ